jgi:hypothetical protein
MSAIDQLLSLHLVSFTIPSQLLTNKDLKMTDAKPWFVISNSKEFAWPCQNAPPGTYMERKPLYPTKASVTLFYRNPVNCLQSLIYSPLIKDHVEFSPLRVFKTAKKLMCLYGEWRTGDVAWEMQLCMYLIQFCPLTLNPLESTSTRCHSSQYHLII